MKTSRLDNILSRMKGRYFGIERKNGAKINARVRKITDKFVFVENRNTNAEMKVAKDTIQSITVAGEVLR